MGQFAYRSRTLIKANVKVPPLETWQMRCRSDPHLGVPLSIAVVNQQDVNDIWGQGRSASIA